MLDSRIKMLITTVNKLQRRGAQENIKRVLEKSHTADIAEVIENLDTGSNIEVYRLVDSLEKRAEILSYLSPNAQEELVYIMEDGEAQAIISRMENDDAADLLAKLPESLSQKILTMMEREDSEEVVDLKAYPEDSAGGIMNSDFLSLDKNLTVQDAISEIQKQHDELVILFYIYVVDDEGQLVGVLSLKQLLLASPSQKLGEIIINDVITVFPETDQEEVARLVERYDFLAIPVVDQSKKLIGVITVDDVIDVIREEVEEDLLAMGRAGWSADASTLEHIKARLPWLILTMMGGLVSCYLILTLLPKDVFSSFSSENHLYWYAMSALPLILSMGVTAGNQAVSVALGIIRKGATDSGVMRDHFFNELRVSLTLSSIFFVLLFVFGNFFLKNTLYGLTLGSALFFQVNLAICLGTLIPFFVQKMGLEPSIASTPLYAVLADILAVAVLFAGIQFY